MRHRVYAISKKYIRFLYVSMVLLSLAFPAILMGISLKRGVTFESSFVILLVILGFVIFITLFHEGRKMIQLIQHRQLELSETRLLIHQENKKELIFFDELENISVYEDHVGRVQAVMLTTVYGSMTKIQHYEDLKDLVHVIRNRAQVIVKRQNPQWMPLGIAGTFIVCILIIVLT